MVVAVDDQDPLELLEKKLELQVVPGTSLEFKEAFLSLEFKAALGGVTTFVELHCVLCLASRRIFERRGTVSKAHRKVEQRYNIRSRCSLFRICFVVSL